jgi:hypothetical protein
MTIIVGISIILNVRYPNGSIKHWIKNKEVAAVTATSKKGRDIMLFLLQHVLIGSATFCVQQLIKIALDAIK